ncbi:MAG: hypothetical protein FWD25_07055 [Clostridia bacterium]|nr:hypothetical protein [Clostridia bacterium]
MFPVLIIQCAQAGLLYVNGQFCGELTEPLMLPVRPEGRVYLEFRPLTGEAFPLAAALEFSQGKLLPPLPASVYALQWPDRVIDLELRPVPMPVADAPREPLSSLTLGKTRLFHQRLGNEEAICTRSKPLFAIPNGTRNLHALPLPEGITLLLGEHSGGASVWLLDIADPEQPALADHIHAQQLALEEKDGTLRALSYANDAVGHAFLTVYRPQGSRLATQSREHAWTPGAPHWPQSGPETLRAYVEAQRLGAEKEATAYLSSAARDLLATAPLPTFHTVLELPRPLLTPPPDHPLSLGLLETQGINLGTVHAVSARAVSSEHAQGRFLLESISVN